MKIDKYDRQIRLWGVKGQRRLGESKIALLGCTGPGIEAIKNMVLPGVGEVDIWDNEKIEVSDLSSSFFYEHTSVGKFKGQEAIKNLLEMNPDVKGQWHNSSVSDLLENPSKLKEYNICIACQLDDNLNQAISEICWKNKVPVIFASSVGFLFYVRNQKEHHFVESQPGQDGMYYMRLSDPFQDLKQYASQWNIAEMIKQIPIGEEAKDDQIAKKLSRVPYPIILMQAYDSLPKEERKVNNLKALIGKWIDCIHTDYRQNFREAQMKYFDLFRNPEDFMLEFDIFEHPEVLGANQNSDIFCQFMKAASIYYKKTGKLPQPTRLPDMQTTSALYIDLKTVYKKQHSNSKREILKIINEQFPSVKDVDEDLISFYIENINGLQITTMNSFFNELKAIDSDSLYDEKDTYLAIRIYQEFRTKQKRVPNMSDLQDLKEFAKGFCERNKVTPIDQRYLQELCRSEGKELISISAMIGAIIGQEAVKLITNVFCPMLTGYAYNGIKCSGAQICV